MYWLAEDVEILKRLWPAGTPAKVISSQLRVPRAEGYISKKAAQLGLVREVRVLKPEHETIIRELWFTAIPSPEIAEKCGISPKQLRRAGHKLGLPDRRSLKTGPWSPERIEKCKELWLGGNHSAREIANELGVTRQAVMGKVIRLKLPKRGRSVLWQRPPSKPRVKKERVVVKKVRALKEWVPKENTLRVRVARVRVVQEVTPKEPRKIRINCTTCKWPIGTDLLAEGYFCGAVVTGGSYCLEHGKIAYRDD